MPGPSAVHDGPRLHLRLPALRRPHGTTAWPPGSRMPGAAQPDTRVSRVVRRSTGERRVRGQRRNREKRPGGGGCGQRGAVRIPGELRNRRVRMAPRSSARGKRPGRRAARRRVRGQHPGRTCLALESRARLHDGAGQPCHCRASGQPCARRPRGAAQQRVRHHRHRRLQAGERQQGPYRRGRAAARDRGHPARQLPCHRRGQPHGRRRVRPAARTHRAAGGVAAPGRDGGPHQRQHGPPVPARPP